MRQGPHFLLIAVFSITAALAFMLAPLPEWISRMRPELLPMVVVYWTILMPKYFGMFFGWIIGLVMDVCFDTVLGQHAIAMVLVSYAMMQFNMTLRNFTIWQQTLTMLPVFTLYEFMLFWLDGVTGRDVELSWRWLPVISSTILWPVLAGAMNYLVRHRHTDS